MFVLSTPNHTHLDMVNCLSLEKATKKNEKLFALKQLFWFFKNILVPDGFGRQPSYYGMLVFGYHSHTHHNPFGLFCPISPSKTCWDTLYSKRQKVSSYCYTKLMYRGEIFDFKAVAKVLGQSMQSFIQRMENSEIRGHF